MARVTRRAGSAAVVPGDGARETPFRSRAVTLPPDVVWSVLAVQAEDSTPASIQIARRLRVAIADGVLLPGDRLPTVRGAARRLSLAANTVARAYAALAREGVILARAGGGSEVAPVASLDRPALTRHRQERLEALARQVAVRGLSLGFSADEIAGALERELARHGQPVSAAAAPTPLGAAEGTLLSARNRLEGRVKAVRAGELLAEVTVTLPAGADLLVVVTRSSLERLGLHEGSPVAAYVKATEPVLGS